MGARKEKQCRVEVLEEAGDHRQLGAMRAEELLNAQR
jgi:hypothetical protein